MKSYFEILYGKNYYQENLVKQEDIEKILINSLLIKHSVFVDTAKNKNITPDQIEILSIAYSLEDIYGYFKIHQLEKYGRWKRASVYKLVKELSKINFITRLPEGRYALTQKATSTIKTVIVKLSQKRSLFET